MTSGQQRAILELHRLQAAGDGVVEFEEPEVREPGWLWVKLSIRIGPIERRPGGLDFKDREAMTLLVPPSYPFEKPGLIVPHRRFAGFPHVDWDVGLCIYQSEVEWNPSDGLYGFFTRLSQWLGRAAANDMDPIEGPMHPPVYVPASSEKAFLISTNSPVEPGEGWLGFAELKEERNRFEVIRWLHVENPLPPDPKLALVLILSKKFPMEFPSKGNELFVELEKQGIDQATLIEYLAIAAHCGSTDDPVYLIVGTPALRDIKGNTRHHFAVWCSDYRTSLRATTAQDVDSEQITEIRHEIRNLLVDAFKNSKLSWCPILEDRPEITVRRDKGRPMTWFAGKRVLLLGCGAIGSWAAEMIARAQPATLDLVDNGVVKPGLLVRQNYTRDDMGAYKATALEARLRQISKAEIHGHTENAIRYLLDLPERTVTYDLILDCTANRSLQMQIESNWKILSGKVRRMVSALIDGTAEHLIAVDLGNTPAHGPWMGYIRLKTALCKAQRAPSLLDAFYSDRSITSLFQPEPGCSDPTFSGSATDVQGHVAALLNLIGAHISTNEAIGYGLSDRSATLPPVHEIVALPRIESIVVGEYRIFVSPRIYDRARDFVEANNKARSKRHETGGLLWGYWDEAARVIEVTDISGPPPDSKHKPTHFQCGTEGTLEEHERRMATSRGNGGFVGMWHTHPDMAPRQSNEDVLGMASLVSSGQGQNRRHALMMIFGRPRGQPEASIYAYESIIDHGEVKIVGIGEALFGLVERVV